MGTVHLELSADLQALIEHQIAAGRTDSAQSFLTEAAHRYAEDLAWEREVTDLVRRADADLAAGHYVTIGSDADAQAWMSERLDRVDAELAKD